MLRFSSWPVGSRYARGSTAAPTRLAGATRSCVDRHADHEAGASGLPTRGFRRDDRTNGSFSPGSANPYARCAVETPPAPPANGELKQMRVRYSATCVKCGTGLPIGAQALYHRATKTFRCARCPTELASFEAASIRAGIPGASAQRKYVRLKAKREAATRERFGKRLGGLVLAIGDEPQSTRAWARGALGEQALATALADLPDIRMLHDRRVPRTRGNIDCLVIGPAGVFVVDAKQHEGLIEVRDVGPLFSPDLRLYVGRHNRSRLADDMGWQVKAVRAALESVGLDELPPIIPVLCFIDGEWSMLFPPDTFRGVRLEGPRSLRKLITRTQRLDAGKVDRLARILATAFPAK